MNTHHGLIRAEKGSAAAAACGVGGVDEFCSGGVAHGAVDDQGLDELAPGQLTGQGHGLLSDGVEDLGAFVAVDTEQEVVDSRGVSHEHDPLAR